MAEEIKIQNRPAFSGWPMIIGWIAMLIFALHACTHMVGAGDTWVAMACGRHFINHGVDTVEPFSANSHHAGPTDESMKKYELEIRAEIAQTVPNTLFKKVKLKAIAKYADWIGSYPEWSESSKAALRYWHPTGWVNQNWLTHVIFYWLTTKSPFADADSYSFNTLVYWKFAVYIITIACVYYIARLMKVNQALAVIFACFALFAGRSLFDIRPAGFSNLMVAVFLLILALAADKNYRFIWLLVPAAVFWCNVHGGYIYLFIMMIPFIGTHFLLNLPKKWTAIVYSPCALVFFILVFNRIRWDELKTDTKAQSLVAMQLILLAFALIIYGITVIFNKNRTVTMSRKGLVHTLAAAFVSFAAVIIFNPFHLTNLTHTFVISVSKYAAQWRMIHEWHPAFEWSNPVGDARPFLIMYILAWLVIIAWFFLTLTSRSVQAQQEKQKLPDDSYKLPKLDLALVLIAAMTIYMAIRSRRFIPVAAIVACPVIALLIDQIIRLIAAKFNLRKNNKFKVPSMPAVVRIVVIYAGIASVLFFGIWWGGKFKRVYLDSWPGDEKLNSVFMRMTASDVKPFNACRFIRENNLSGKMFNYWTEGGFIAYGQTPDPNTGKTPLQLFMDGRAQAAYQYKSFEEWSAIMSGGPSVYIANMRKKRLDKNDYIEIGKYVDSRLKEHNVWIVLMPIGEFDSPFVVGIEYNNDWFLAYQDEQQKLWVDSTTPQGKKLMQDIFSGEAKFPTEFSCNLVLAYNYIFRNPDIEAKKKGLALAVLALEQHPSQPPIRIMMFAARFPELSPSVIDAVQKYYNDFLKNKDQLITHDGYRNRAVAAIDSAALLGQFARIQNNSEKSQQYTLMRTRLELELTILINAKRW